MYKKFTIKNPILLFYQNDKSVIIGRNQNPWKECKLNEIKKRDISICRRNSGGGAVYQDLGNLCFSFITPVFKNVLPLDMKNFHNKILIDGLQNIEGLSNIQEQGRNDLIIDNKKFSGSAFEVDLGGKTKQQKVLHHGTILMNTDFNIMQYILNPNILKMKSKGIESVKSRVINLKEVKSDLTKDMIIKNITYEFINQFGNENISYEIKYIDNQFIEKYPEINTNIKQMQDKNWILGECPQFTNEFTDKLSFGLININLDVNKGQITTGKIFSDSLFPDFIDNCNEILRQQKYEYSNEGIEVFKQNLLSYNNKNQKNWDQMIEELMEFMKKSISNQ